MAGKKTIKIGGVKMEVFIREKSCETCPFANKEKPNFICGDAIANDIGLKTNSSVCKLNYFANEENCPLKSLEQHDAELKKIIYKEAYEQGKFDIKTDLEYKINLAQHDAEVRKQVIAELEEWLDNAGYDVYAGDNHIKDKKLREKLEQIKGETK